MSETPETWADIGLIDIGLKIFHSCSLFIISIFQRRDREYEGEGGREAGRMGRRGRGGRGGDGEEEVKEEEERMRRQGKSNNDNEQHRA